MEEVKCIYHTGPVTALHVVDTTIIAGCGDYLYRYDVDTAECLQIISVLPCTRIHGIRTLSGNNGLLCVFGEKKSCIVTLDSDGLSKTDKGVELQDLIWDAQFLHIRDNTRTDVVFALAHNTIVKWNYGGGKITDIVQCEENSILYCARFITTDWDRLILAAGTVINQVLLWSPMTTRNDAGQSTVMHRFKGHQGVIFSVRYNRQRQHICSVSDDRSIRIWQLTFPNKVSMATDDLDLTDWEQCLSTPLHVLYGHSARVWDINLLHDVMISIGEDSVCCVWNYSGEVIQKFKGHKGKSIWSLATDEQGQFFVTGGGDTSIRLWKLNQAGNQSQNKINSCSLPFPDKDVHDFVRTVTFWRSNFVLGMTDNGSLLIHGITDGTTRLVFSEKNFKSYTVMSVSDVICVGNIEGTIRVLHANHADNIHNLQFIWKDYNIYTGKVFSTHWLSNGVLLTTGPEGEISCYNIFPNEDEIGDLKLVAKYSLPYCKQRWVSTATVSNDKILCGDRAGTIHVYKWGGQDDQLLEPVQSFWKIHGKAGVTDVCTADNMVYTAGRDGHYRTFNLDNDGLTLLNSNRVSKGFDWLDRLELREDGDMYIYGFQSDNFVLFSVNNNQRLVQIPCGGGHRTWDCQIMDNKVKFVYLKMKEVILCNTDLLTNQVLIKESLHGRETTCMRHLYSCISGNSQPVDIILTCSEDTTILVSKLSCNNKGILQLSHLHTFRDHISNVKCMTICPSYTGSHLVFTGGSRAQFLATKITLQQDLDGSYIKTTFQTLKSCHLGEEWLSWKQKKSKLFESNPETRIMDLCVLPLRDILVDSPGHLYVLGSACSDGYVRFYIFDEKLKMLTPVCDSNFHDHCVLKMVYMFITVRNSRRCIFLSAGTDGRIALWDVSKYLTKFLTGYKSNNVVNQLLPKDNASCVHKNIDPTNEKSEILNQTEPAENIFASDKSKLQIYENNTETSGSLCEGQQSSSDEKDSEESQFYEPMFVITSHQSGINGLNSNEIDDGRLMIASGGDDNALVVSIISISESSMVILDGQYKELSAHAAQITGVHIINSRKILTASVDQRMCLWDINYTDSIPRLSQVWCKFVNVPDICHIEIWKRKDRTTVGLCGEGLSVFEMEEK